MEQMLYRVIFLLLLLLFLLVLRIYIVLHPPLSSRISSISILFPPSFLPLTPLRLLINSLVKAGLGYRCLYIHKFRKKPT